MEVRKNRNPNLSEIGCAYETKDPADVNARLKAGWRMMMLSVFEGGPAWYCLGLPKTLRRETIGERRETTDPDRVFELLSTDNWRILSVVEQADGSTLYSLGLPKAV